MNNLNHQSPQDSEQPHGAFASVKFHEKDGIKLAEKRYFPYVESSFDAMQTVRNSLRIRKANPQILDSQLIFPIEDRFEKDRVVVFNRVEGATLWEWNRANLRALNALPISYPAIKSVISSVIDDIAKLMASNLVHRDLKGNNIIIRPDGRATLLDLDFLATTDGDNVDRDMYQGNPITMSPEVAVHSISATSDVFSLGMMVLTDFFSYRVREVIGLATEEEISSGPHGRWMHPGTRPPETRQSLRRLTENYPDDVRVEIYGLIEFIIEALQPRPSDRPDSAKKMLELINSRPNLQVI